MSLHDQSVGKTDEWYTPAYVFDALDTTFDLDVAAPVGLQYINTTALDFYCHDSLTREWKGFVWMNAPFGKRMGIVPWLVKFFDHKNGIALVPDRTSCPWWQEFVPKADLVLFVKGKIRFIDQSGNEGKSPADGTCLLAIGEKACESLRSAEKAGLGIIL
jgi:hypothetical protein